MTVGLGEGPKSSKYSKTSPKYGFKAKKKAIGCQ